MSEVIKLDYSLKTPEERLALVNQILEENPHPSAYYLELLANYLVFLMEKEEKKEKEILTDNRLSTINKREIAYEGLISHFENGEDGIYNIVTNDKHIIMDPKKPITDKDRREIPEIEQAESSAKA